MKVGTRATLYEINEWREFEVSAAMLGANFAGHRIHDGCNMEYNLKQATHQHAWLTSCGVFAS